MRKICSFAIMLSLLIYITTSCDAWSVDINVQQSIYNQTSDTIVIINSKKEFCGIDIDTIVCYPFSKKVFYNNTHKNQPLEPYNIPLIYEGSEIVISSGKLLMKDIFNDNNWVFDKQEKHEWLSFTIDETDLE
jgi:hypothetical protein